MAYFKLKNPQSNIAVWAGGFRLHLRSETAGSLPLNEVIPTDGLQDKVDSGMEKVADAQIAVDAWWEGLTPAEQNNPVNEAKYNTANRALETTGNLLNGIDGALSDEQTATVQYSLSKRPKDVHGTLFSDRNTRSTNTLCYSRNTVSWEAEPSSLVVCNIVLTCKTYKS